MTDDSLSLSLKDVKTQNRHARNVTFTHNLEIYLIEYIPQARLDGAFAILTVGLIPFFICQLAFVSIGSTLLASSVDNY